MVFIKLNNYFFEYSLLILDNLPAPKILTFELPCYFVLMVQLFPINTISSFCKNLCMPKEAY